MKKLLLLAFSILTIQMLQAQDQFERLYRATGREFLAMDVQQTSGGGYLMLSIVQNEDNGDLEQANVTNVDPKGNINWSKDYDFEENLQATGDLVLLENDSFSFSILLAESELNNVVVKAAPDGEVVWSNSYGRPDFVVPNILAGRETDITYNPDRGFNVFGPQSTLTESGVYGARLDSLGNILWANNYTINSFTPFALSGIQDAQVTQDSGFILAGRTSEFASNGEILLMKLDSLGNVLWGNQYGNGDVFSSKFGDAIVQTPDLGYAMAGFEIEGDFPPSTNGFVMKTDSLGEVLWYRSVDVDSFFTTNSRFTDIALTAGGELIVSGYGSDIDNTNSFSLMMQFDQLGNVVTDQKYNQPVSLVEDVAIAATNDGGMINFGVFQDEDETAIPYLVKGNEMGESSCSDTLVYVINQLDTVPTIALTFSVVNVDTMLLEEPLVMDYDSFSVPVLALSPPPPFCEGDPINVTFDATVQGAVSYEWSTGETTPMITVMEEGLYTVDVRVEEDVCFNLCDTVVISTTGPPTVEIAQDLSGFCTDGVGVLEAQIQGFASLIEWSTGAADPFIFIDEPGTYSVTVTNQCGMDEASVTITEFPEVLPSFAFAIDDSGLCDGEPATIVADVISGDLNSVMWTTPDGEIVSGGNTNILIAGSPGTYTISASNNCGTSTQDVVLAAVPPTVNIEIVLDSLCAIDTTILGFNGTGINSFEWSNGETNQTQIIASEQATYSITVTNGCGMATDEITLNCEFPFTECLMIPNAFTPNNDSNNDGFSPVIPEGCEEGITIRRLTIWSRWGKKVFDEAGNNAVWDGMDGNNPASADVYIYLVDAVNDDGEERIFKGDVTLIR